MLGRPLVRRTPAVHRPQGRGYALCWHGPHTARLKFSFRPTPLLGATVPAGRIRTEIEPGQLKDPTSLVSSQHPSASRKLFCRPYRYQPKLWLPLRPGHPRISVGGSGLRRARVAAFTASDDVPHHCFNDSGRTAYACTLLRMPRVTLRTMGPMTSGRSTVAPVGDPADLCRGHRDEERHVRD